MAEQAVCKKERHGGTDPTGLFISWECGVSLGSLVLAAAAFANATGWISLGPVGGAILTAASTSVAAASDRPRATPHGRLQYGRSCEVATIHKAVVI